MSFDIKNIVFGIIIGISIMLFNGNLDIQTEIELGNNDKEEQNIQISIEEIIDNDNEIIQISVEAKGSVTSMTLIKNWQNYIQNMI